MRKILLCLAVVMALSMASCQKDDDIRPVTPQPEEPETPAIDLSVDLTGTWSLTPDTYFKIMFYRQSDGSLIDSTLSDLGEEGFTFDGQGNATTTPWGIAATYTLDSTQIHFNIMGIVILDYDLLALSTDHMSFQRVKTAEYSTSEDGVEITVDGVETEYWDLKRN